MCKHGKCMPLNIHVYTCVYWVQNSVPLPVMTTPLFPLQTSAGHQGIWHRKCYGFPCMKTLRATVELSTCKWLGAA